MDFKNLCQNIDVDSIRARIPALPLAMPSLPQIKFPKSMPKLRSRRIFKSSREDVSKTSPKQEPSQPVIAPPPPPSEFINHSPRRISTISSLMYQSSDKRRSTYRSACSIDEDYPSPRQNSHHASRPISPNASLDTPRAAGSTSNTVKMSLSEKLQKSYKDLSEFRLKHIFAKKTVVRKDNIEVDQYVHSFEEDRRRQQEQQAKRDQQIADNYRFKFKVSRQNTGHTDSISSHESATKAQRGTTGGKSVSDDESGMEDSPPKRKAGIAATRFAKVRHPPLQQSMSEDSNAGVDEDEDLGDYEMPADMEPNQSALWGIKESKHSAEASPVAAEKKDDKTSASSKNGSYKERLKRLKSFVSSQEETANESAPESSAAGAKVMSKLREFGNKRNDGKAEVSTGAERKRKAPLTPQQSEEQEEGKTPAIHDNPLITIKQNIKRFQKSIKRQHVNNTNESEVEEGATKETKSTTKADKFTARLRRFKSRETSLDEIDDADAKQEEGNKSPMRTAISNKLQNWTKSFKKKTPPTQTDTNTGDESSPEKQKRPDTLMQKLKYIRERKNPSSADELDADDDEEAPNKSKETAAQKSSNLEERFEQARQKTIKKVNEKMQQIKFFHKSQENIDKETAKRSNKTVADEERDDNDNEDEDEAGAVNTRPKIAKRDEHNDSDSEQDNIEEIANVQPNYLSQKTRAVWTTRNILSESIDSETDCEFPRVLIHQDNSDVFESTLIIAVTRPAPPSPTPIITEITPEKRTPSPRPVDWIPNKEVVSTFLEITPPPRQRKLSVELVVPPKIQGHARKLSMDSNSDSDSWIPEAVRTKHLSRSKDSLRRASTAGLISIDESEEPWKVHSMFREEKLHKAKSIDIFEVNKRRGGANAAFEDFDDELKDEPVVRISPRNADSFDRESSEDIDAPDDDNSSRITKIRIEAQTVQESVTFREMPPATVEEKLNTVAAKDHIKQIGNSCESLEANYDESEELYSDDEDDDLPPNEAPPPPPPNMSPPPPPLPQRQPSIRLPKEVSQAPPPLPASKPPLPATKPPLPPSKPPPNIPERTPSMSRISKPLVKTSSLRLAYNEQVKPADVGKVNKLISRFEQPQGRITDRPRIIQRRALQYDSDDYTDDEDDEEDSEDDVDEVDDDPMKLERDSTPTPTNTPRNSSMDSLRVTKTEKTKTVKQIENAGKHESPPIARDREQNITVQPKTKPKSPAHVPKLTLNIDVNSNCSRPSSEYGSPLEYPSSLIGSTETTPIPDRRLQDIRSRRSMTRDDDNFLSFDSDEENSYYSISSSGSNRYIVEI